MSKLMNLEDAQELRNNIYSIDTLPNDLKAYYNLGAYDTVDTSNADYDLITRQTGYIDWNYLSSRTAYQGGSGNYFYFNIDDSLWNNLAPNYKFINNNGLANSAFSPVNSGSVDSAIAFSNSGTNNSRLAIRKTDSITSVTTLTNWVSTNQLVVQYKLATSYTEKVIKERPLNTLNQQGSQWVRDEYEKGLNLFDINNLNVGSVSGNVVSISAGAVRSSIFKRAITFDKGSYTLSASSYNTGNGNTRLKVYYTDGTSVDVYSLPFISSSSLTISSIGLNYGSSSGNGLTIDSPMLNKGSTVLPYQPYSGGEIARTGDIEPVLLWEESNKNAAQSAKNISVPNYRSYKYLVLEYKQWYSSTQPLYYQKIKIGNDLNGGIALCCTAVSTSENLSAMRSIEYPSLSSGGQTFTIHDCSANSQTDNNRLVLTAIYGTNNL